MSAQSIGNKSVYVISGTGTRGIKQVNVTGTTGAGVFQTWTQITAAQYAQGPTGQFETVQRVNAGTVLTQSTKTVCISSFVDPNAGGGGGYTAKAVHFDGSGPTYLLKGDANTTAHAITFAMWIRLPVAANGVNCFLAAPVSGNGNSFVFGTGINSSTDLGITASDDGYNTDSLFEASDNGVFVDNTWTFIFGSMNTNTPPVTRTVNLYAGTSSVLDPANSFEAGSAMASLDITSLWCPYAPTAINDCDMADVRVWLNQCIDPTPANLAKFIAAGKPVDPATATTAFGQPAVLFSGDASTFATNQGTLGAFTLDGILTNASTHP